jgi:hypothetical protein
MSDTGSMIALALVLGMLGISALSIPFGAESRDGFDERTNVS